LVKFTRNLIILFHVFLCPCYSADVIFLDVSPIKLAYKHQIDLICQFYGLEAEYFVVEDEANNSLLRKVSNWNSIQAMVISEKAFLEVDLLALLKERNEKIPVLVTGVTRGSNKCPLNELSNRAIIRCERKEVQSLKLSYKLSNKKALVSELAELAVPFSSEEFFYFDLKKNHMAYPIIQIENSETEKLYPIFIQTFYSEHEVFFSTRQINSDRTNDVNSNFNTSLFFQIAPLMIFIKYAYSDRCWHSAKNYANLIIDDPWLIEPYGQLNYKGLYAEMQNAHFHTTIAFIPWNYDQSKPHVVSLFRNHPERLSICIHGNNHDHYEFYKYETGPGDPWPAKPLNTQEANIKQALARMEKFRTMTGISYDKVMVFPHGIAPAKTLGLLKKYNFLATVNAENFPLGSYEPKDSSFLLRPVTLNFENFPSLKRYSPNRTQAEIAIDLFLDNPLIFYAHHDFFQNGIDAFDKTANMVNKIQPDIVWQSLGYIAQHLYLEKLRDDGNYDVKTFSSNFILENIHRNDLVYFVRKEEDFSIPIKQVTVDGQPFSYKKNGNNLILEVFVPAGESRNVVIEYENSLDISSVDVSKNDPRINRLRKLSDFRDMTLSKNVFGRVFTRVYYDTGLYKFGLIRLAVILLIFFVLFVVISLVSWRIIRSRKTGIKI